MLIRLFAGILITAATASAVMAKTNSGDTDRPLVTGRLYSAADVKPAKRATQLDVSRLKKLRTRPSVKCARIEYVYQCLSSQPMHLSKARCRAGSTEASCCKGVRDYVNSKICGPVWNRLKKAGKTYFPGIWLCKCIETAPTLKRNPDTRIQRR